MNRSLQSLKNKLFKVLQVKTSVNGQSADNSILVSHPSTVNNKSQNPGVARSSIEHSFENLLSPAHQDHRQSQRHPSPFDHKKGIDEKESVGTLPNYKMGIATTSVT